MCDHSWYQGIVSIHIPVTLVSMKSCTSGACNLLLLSSVRIINNNISHNDDDKTHKHADGGSNVSRIPQYSSGSTPLQAHAPLLAGTSSEEDKHHK